MGMAATIQPSSINYGETSDMASLFDTPGNDTYVTAGTYSYMAGEDGTFRLVDGLPEVFGYTINGGSDQAWHYDTDAENETFYSSGTSYTVMTGDNFYNVAFGFPVNYAYSSGGDNAVFTTRPIPIPSSA